MANKSVTIKSATDKELDELIIRFRKESEVQSLIAEIKRKSGSGYMPYDYGQEISTEKSVELLYHFGIPGMKWGRRTKKNSSGEKTKEQIDREKRQREKILSSPTKLYKNRHKFSQEEIDAAMKKMKWERELRSLSKDELKRGEQYVNTFLDYAKTASRAYDLYKSPLGTAIVNKMKKSR